MWKDVRVSLVHKMGHHFWKLNLHLLIQADLCVKRGRPAFENVCKKKKKMSAKQVL